MRELFKSRAERERDEAKRRRIAFRSAQKAVDDVKDRIAKLENEARHSWGEARDYLRDGQKAAAMRYLQKYRNNEMLVAKLEMKRWVFEQLLNQLEIAKSDQEFAKSLKAINTVVEINPELVADILGDIQDKIGEQVDVDKIWEQMYAKEMRDTTREMHDVIPTIEEMEKQLQDEVVSDLGGAVSDLTTGREKEQRISEGRERLRKLLDGEK